MEYVIMSILAVILGQICKQLCLKFPPVVAEEITYPQFLSGIKKDFKVDLKYSLIFLIIHNFILFSTQNLLMSVIYSLVIFSLAIVFSVDYRFELIPDECSLFIGYIALIKILLTGSSIVDALLGALLGGGIFYLLGKLAVMIFKKEGMGFGDVKLMAVLGLLFGIKTTFVLTFLAFFIGAIISCICLVVKKKGFDSYIPFGPFIVIAAVLLMFIEPQYFIDLYIDMCSSLSYFITDILFNIAGK
ncbi:MAG: A24 family peptidase [Clostridia bacterium]